MHCTYRSVNMDPVGIRAAAHRNAVAAHIILLHHHADTVVKYRLTHLLARFRFPHLPQDDPHRIRRSAGFPGSHEFVRFLQLGRKGVRIRAVTLKPHLLTPGRLLTVLPDLLCRIIHVAFHRIKSSASTVFQHSRFLSFYFFMICISSLLPSPPQTARSCAASVPKPVPYLPDRPPACRRHISLPHRPGCPPAFLSGYSLLSRQSQCYRSLHSSYASPPQPARLPVSLRHSPVSPGP